MNRLLPLIFLLLLTCPVLGQSSGTASQLAQQLAAVQEFPTNVRLRFQILAREVGRFDRNEPTEDLLYFFSDTRVMVWKSPG